MTVPYAEFDPTLLFMQAVAQIVLTIEFMIIAILLIKKYQERKKVEVKYLFIVLLSMSIGIGLSTIPMILCMAGVDSFINTGLPVFIGGYTIWWSNITYVLMNIAAIFILRFTNGLFRKPEKKVIVIYSVICAAFAVWSIYFGLFNYVPGERSLTIPMALIFIILEFYSWVNLLVVSRKDAKRVEKSVFKVGLQMISVSAGFTVAGFFLWTFSMVTGLHQELGWIIWIFNCITGLTLYLGYILPPWFRDMIEKRLNAKN